MHPKMVFHLILTMFHHPKWLKSRTNSSHFLFHFHMRWCFSIYPGFCIKFKYGFLPTCESAFFISDKWLLRRMSVCSPSSILYKIVREIFLKMVLIVSTKSLHANLSLNFWSFVPSVDLAEQDRCRVGPTLHRSCSARSTDKIVLWEVNIKFFYLCVLMCSEIRAGLAPPDRLSLLLVYLA